MVGFQIQSSTVEKASGALPKLIPTSSLPVAMMDVDVNVENGGTVDWVTAYVIPSPPPQNQIYTVSMAGTFGQMTTDNFVHIVFPSSVMISSHILTGYFTFQKVSSSLNVSYYWTVESSSMNDVVLRFQKRDLIVDPLEPFVFSMVVNFF